jgi:hypothetical protein
MTNLCGGLSKQVFTVQFTDKINQNTSRIPPSYIVKQKLGIAESSPQKTPHNLRAHKIELNGNKSKTKIYGLAQRPSKNVYFRVSFHSGRPMQLQKNIHTNAPEPSSAILTSSDAQIISSRTCELPRKITRQRTRYVSVRSSTPIV